MNIDDYRAMKAEAEQEAKEPEVVAPTEPEVEEPKTEDEAPIIEDKPETIEIDGKELTIEELKNGYLRQSDYTRKTQEARRLEEQAKEALSLTEQLRKNPSVAEELGKSFDLPNLDPRNAEYTEMENKYYDLLIESEVNKLTTKYGDFDVKEVLKIARDNNISDLDTAYHVSVSRQGGTKEAVDVEALKEQIRQEVMNDVKIERDANTDTSTIIGQGGGTKQVRSDAPTLNSQEAKVAQGMGLSPKEYSAWRDTK